MAVINHFNAFVHVMSAGRIDWQKTRVNENLQFYRKGRDFLKKLGSRDPEKIFRKIMINIKDLKSKFVHANKFHKKYLVILKNFSGLFGFLYKKNPEKLLDRKVAFFEALTLDPNAETVRNKAKELFQYKKIEKEEYLEILMFPEGYFTVITCMFHKFEIKNPYRNIGVDLLVAEFSELCRGEKEKGDQVQAPKMLSGSQESQEQLERVKNPWSEKGYKGEERLFEMDLNVQ